MFFTPRAPEMLKRPIFSYIEIGCISAFTSWIIFLSHSFSLLFTDAPRVEPELFPLMGADVCAVSGMIALTYKGQGWSETGGKKTRERISMGVWCEIGGGVGEGARQLLF